MVSIFGLTLCWKCGFFSISLQKVAQLLRRAVVINLPASAWSTSFTKCRHPEYGGGAEFHFKYLHPHTTCQCYSVCVCDSIDFITSRCILDILISYLSFCTLFHIIVKQSILVRLGIIMFMLWRLLMLIFLTYSMTSRWYATEMHFNIADKKKKFVWYEHLKVTWKLLNQVIKLRSNADGWWTDQFGILLLGGTSEKKACKYSGKSGPWHSRAQYLQAAI